jgi:hypothetical protein
VPEVNRSLIPAAFDGTRGRSYSYVDRAAGRWRRIRYSLMGVYLDGRRAWLGSAVTAG